MHIDESLKST